MTCITNKPYYLPHTEGGILTAVSRGDGYSIGISWNKAYPDIHTYYVAYNIYYSTFKSDVFSEGVKYIVNDQSETKIDLLDFTPGDTFYFSVRATEYDPSWMLFDLLPDSGDSKIIPESILANDISETETSLELIDSDGFPSYGVVHIGGELIRYTGKSSNILTGLTRGFLGSNARIHNVDGYDGYTTRDPVVKFWQGLEEQNQVIFQETSHFSYPEYPKTEIDGYKEVLKDNLTTDLSGSDAAQDDFPRYDYAGWHRTNLVSLLQGECLDTYYGGEYYCADGYSGVGRVLKGVPLNVESQRRQEMMLELTGEPVVLVQRFQTGKRCKCFTSTSEYPDDRCPYCTGSGFVTGYKQFFNPRRSDGRILVRFSPSEDDLKMDDAGLESTLQTDAWTIVYPAIKDRDFFIRYTQDGLEEFRYEVLNVTRNKLLQSIDGAQKMRIQRVRKTDPIYHWKAIANTETIPQTINSSIGMVSGSIAPHFHTVTINENIISIGQITQTTSVSLGHNHPVIDGVVQEVLGHTHTLSL